MTSSATAAMRNLSSTWWYPVVQMGTAAPPRERTVTPMNIPDLVFLTGPIGAPVLASLSVAAIAVVRGPRLVFIVLGAALTAVVALSFIAYWFFWGPAFDYADANRPVPTRLDLASNLMMTLSSIASLALVVLAAAAVIAKLRARRRVEPTATLAEHL